MGRLTLEHRRTAIYDVRQSSEMKEMTMLDLQKIDLPALADALEDHSDEITWWFDPRSGGIEAWSESFSSEAEGEHPDDRGLIPIEPLPSGVGYRDMEEFITRVADARAKELLRRAIEGRGAFRRFKDTLLEYPELREIWFAFHDARIERRALGWLADEDIVDREVAQREIALRPDPDLPRPSEALDAEGVARAVAADLRELYGDRLRRVVLFGSWARRDAHPESDIDLLVVLDRVDSAWEELRSMDAILWRHSFANNTVVSATPVAEGDLRAERWPLLRRARAEGREVFA
ncbi:MAG: nucleotidyltransferase domain-containing protein [Actinobacteria bacterium]|nr:nucleotidyltransferase domain-containing protein [Actinomycetota bacterium]